MRPTTVVSVSLNICLANALVPDVAVAAAVGDEDPIIDVTVDRGELRILVEEDRRIDDAADDCVDDEALLVDRKLAASRDTRARAAHAVLFAAFVPTYEPMLATTAWLSRSVTVAAPLLLTTTVWTASSTLVGVPLPLCSYEVPFHVAPCLASAPSAVR